MKNKDIKAIAEIIKEEMKEISNSYMKDVDKEVARASPRVIACRLSDYFEREDRKVSDKKGIDCIFNRKQFLKDCGVE